MFSGDLILNIQSSKANLINANTLFLQRTPILFAWLVFAFAASWGLSTLSIDADYRSLFSPDDPVVISDQKMVDTYLPSDTAIILLAPKDKNALSPISLQQQLEMTEAAWLLPFSARVDSMANFQHIFSEGDDLEVKNLIGEPESIHGEKLDALRKLIKDDTDMYGRLLSKDDSVSAIVISFRLPENSFENITKVGLATYALRDHFLEQYPDTNLHLTGMMLGNFEMMNMTLGDISTLMPTMAAVIMVMLILLFRSFYAMLLTMTVILISVASTIGLQAWVGAPLTGPSGAAPIIILTIAVADCVHILASFFQEYNDGASKRDAITSSIQINAMPVIITSVTTGIGFLSMNFSEVPPFHVLGNDVALGALIACVASLTLMPLLVDVLPIKRQKFRNKNGKESSIAPLAQHILKHRIIYFVGTSLFALTLGSFAQKNVVNDQLVKYYGETVPFRIDTDFATEKLSGLSDLSISLKSPYEKGVFDPRYLQGVNQFETWLKKHPQIVQTQTIATTFKSLNKAMHGNDDAYYKLPEEADLIAQYFLLYEMSLPYGLSATSQISFNKQESKIFLNLKEQSTHSMLDFENEIKQYLKTHLPEYQYTSSSIGLLFSHIGVSNAKSMLVGTFIALLLMSLVIGLALKSVKLGFVSLLTNLIPPALAFGVWGIISGEVGLSISVAIGMTLGIVVDNTVHLLAKYQLAQKEGYALEKSIIYAYSKVGAALLICNGVLVAGFMILAQSQFKLNSDMGLFTSITFVMALTIVFIMLPPVLYWMDKFRKVEASEPNLVISKT